MARSAVAHHTRDTDSLFTLVSIAIIREGSIVVHSRDRRRGYTHTAKQHMREQHTASLASRCTHVPWRRATQHCAGENSGTGRRETRGHDTELTQARGRSWDGMEWHGESWLVGSCAVRGETCRAWRDVLRQDADAQRKHSHIDVRRARVLANEERHVNRCCT